MRRLNAKPMARPGRNEGSARFWDFIARRYARTPVPDEAVYQEKLTRTRAYLAPEMTALEFGCGTGSTAVAHAPYLQRIVAIDVSAKMIEIARGRAAEAGVDNVEFAHMSFERFEAEDSAFDVVFALSILHLVRDRPATLAKVWRLLKPGGVLVASTAALAEDMNWMRGIAAVGACAGLLPKVAFFTAQDLVDEAERQGFLVEERWKPGKGKALFLVARKPAAA